MSESEKPTRRPVTISGSAAGTSTARAVANGASLSACAALRWIGAQVRRKARIGEQRSERAGGREGRAQRDVADDEVCAFPEEEKQRTEQQRIAPLHRCLRASSRRSQTCSDMFTVITTVRMKRIIAYITRLSKLL